MNRDCSRDVADAERFAIQTLHGMPDHKQSEALRFLLVMGGSEIPTLGGRVPRPAADAHVGPTLALELAGC